MNRKTPTSYRDRASRLLLVYVLLGALGCCTFICGCADRDATAGVVKRIDRLERMLLDVESGTDFCLNIVAEYRADAQEYLRWAWLKRMVNRDQLIKEYNNFNLKAEGHEQRYNAKRKAMLQLLDEWDQLSEECDRLLRQCRVSSAARARISRFSKEVEKALPRLLEKLSQLEQSKKELGRIMKETEYSVMTNPPRLPRPQVAWRVPDPDIVLKAAQLGLSLGGKSRFCKGAAILLSIAELFRAIENE